MLSGINAPVPSSSKIASKSNTISNTAKTLAQTKYSTSVKIINKTSKSNYKPEQPIPITENVMKNKFLDFILNYNIDIDTMIANLNAYILNILS